MEEKIDLGEYVAKKLKDESLHEIIFLFHASYGYSPSYDSLKNKHQYCHGDEKYIGFIAYHKETGEPAAFYGVFPTFIVYDGKKYLAAQSGDTMTHPNHQKKGLFTKLAQTTFAYCEEIGIQLIYGFPNNNSFPGFIKHLGFTALEPLKQFNLTENKFELHRITKINKTITALHRVYASSILRLLSTKESHFQNSNLVNNQLACVLRDEKYYKTKTTEDKIVVSVLGVKFWIKQVENCYIIGDIEQNKNVNWSKLLRRLKLISYLSGYRFFTYTLSQNSVNFQKISSYIITEHSPQKVIVRDFNSGIPLENFAFLSSDIDVF